MEQINERVLKGMLSRLRDEVGGLALENAELKATVTVLREELAQARHALEEQQQPTEILEEGE